LIAASFAGCTSITGGGSDSDNPIKVGLLAPTSGPYGDVGSRFVNSTKLATDRFNNIIDGRPIQIEVRDSATDPGKATRETNDLVKNEDVDGLLGTFSSSATLAVQAIAKREQVPFVSPSGASIKTTGKECNNYTFIKYVSGFQVGGSALALVEQDVANSFYFITADYTGGRGTHEGMVSTLESQTDADIVGNSYAPFGNDDYSSQISNARDSGADMVWFVTYGNDSLTLMKQSLSAGLQNEMELGFAAGQITIADAIGSEQLKDTYAAVDFYWKLPEAEQYSQEYMDAYGFPPAQDATDQFECTMELLNAFKSTSMIDADSVVEHLHGNEFNYTRGPEKWRECNHRAIQPTFALRGKPPDEKSQAHDYYEVVGSATGEKIMQSCSETGCQMDEI
jgi:branched-chain amino acid transport system substrate-binding protein